MDIGQAVINLNHLYGQERKLHTFASIFLLYSMGPPVYLLVYTLQSALSLIFHQWLTTVVIHCGKLLYSWVEAFEYMRTYKCIVYEMNGERVHFRRLVKNIELANQNTGKQKVVKSNKCMGISQLLGARARAAP